jgi:hypothetical protein
LFLFFTPQSLPFALLQSVIMFVLELQFIDANLAKEKDDAKLEHLSERLKVYEFRALNLFRDIDLTHCGVGIEAGLHPSPEKQKEPLVKLGEVEEHSDLELLDD